MSFADDEVLDNELEAPYLRDDIKPRYELISVTHELTEDLVSFDNQNDVMALLGVRGTVILRETSQSTQPLKATVRQGHKIFLHPFGVHCFVSTLDGYLHYFNLKHRKATLQFSLQAKGSEASSTLSNVAETVCWMSTSRIDEKSTGAVLVGTRTGGLIFDVCVNVENAQLSTLTNCKLLGQVSGSISYPISGIEYESIRGKTMILITTPARLYRIFRDGKDPRKILSDALREGNLSVVEHPTTGDARGSLAIFRSKIGSRGQAFAWSSSAGIVTGLFNHKDTTIMDEEKKGDDALWTQTPVLNETLYALHKKNKADNRLGLPDKAPTEVHLTAFHMILMYEDRLIVCNHPAGLTWKPLSGPELQDYDIADRFKFDPFRYRKVRKLLGVVRDVASRKIYIYSPTSLWELLLEHEHQTQWRLFLERAIDPAEGIPQRKRYFTAAYNLSRGNSQRRDLVQFARGKFWLELQQPDVATTMLAECHSRFEDILDMLMNNQLPSHDHETLRKFLEKKYKLLVQFRKGPHEMQAQIACVTVLLVQLKLDHITSHERESGGEKETKELDNFLSSSIRSNPDVFEDQPYYNVVGKLLTSQGRIASMLLFAEQLHRVHYTINYFISREEYVRACEILTKYGKNKSYAETWYDFSPILIVNCPVRLITGLLKAVERRPGGIVEHLLDIERLVPAFIRYRPELNEDPEAIEHQVILFLEQCIERYGCISTVIHNYYVSLLAKEDTERLDSFFEATEPSTGAEQFFTTEFALRRCLELRRFKQCIPLYRRLYLYEDAINVALESTRPMSDGRWEGLEIAKGILNDKHAQMDSVTRKKLWLSLAERVIERIGTEQALVIVQESNGILKLEDVLSKINDNTVIQNFKQAVCDSLDEYTTAITVLNTSQREANNISESIKKDIAEAKHRYGYVTSRQRCLLCTKGLLQGASPFLVFPACRHVFHEACVVKRLESIGGLSAFRKDPGIPTEYLDGISTTAELAQSECVMCGECAILEITKDLFDDSADVTWRVE